MNKQRFNDAIKQTEDKKDKLGRAIIAFVSGGIVALIGQGFYDLYTKVLDVSDKDGISLMLVTVIFITALLTVIGFSIHDTIVIYDRIRENNRFLAKKYSFNEIVNASVNQTLTRSINTSLTTLFTLFALYFFGGATTKDFVLAMILGIAIGTYSSIFFCSSLIEIWEDKK